MDAPSHLDSPADFLSSVEILSPFTHEEIEALAANAESRRFGFGETVCNAGDAADGLYVVKAGSVRIFGQPFPAYYLLVLGLSPLVAVGLWLVFYRTRWGMLVRAATVDREMLGALGVDVSKLYTQVFAFGSWLAGLGGALAAPTVAVALGMDADVLINAFVVVVIGGLGSFAGTLISALLVGELQSFGILIFPGVSIVLPFALMAVVLMIRPWGLLGEPEE